MYVTVVPNRGSPPAILLRETYREGGGKVKNRTLGNLTRSKSRRSPRCARCIGDAPEMLPDDWGYGYPNVWLIVSVDQAAIERDVPKLLAIPAMVRGVSIEPQLAPVHLGKFAPLLQWVINGGKSGAGARPFHLEWARALEEREHPDIHPETGQQAVGSVKSERR